MILAGLAIAIAVGIAVGIFNYILILGLRIPPIIATLSSSFVIPSRHRLWPGAPHQAAAAARRVHHGEFAGIPVLAIAVVILAAVMSVVLHRTLYGRSVTAIGQSIRAAAFAGIRVGAALHLRPQRGAGRPLRLPVLRLLGRLVAVDGRAVHAPPRSP